MNELMLLAENFKVSVLAGVNLGWQGIGGIILFLTGYISVSRRLKAIGFSRIKNRIFPKKTIMSQCRQRLCRR